MEKEAQQLTGVAVTGNFTISATMPNGKTINVSGYLYDGEDIASVHQRVSLCDDVIDFQRTRAEIPELEIKLKQLVKRLGEFQLHYAALIQKKDVNGKLNSQERAALDVKDINLEQLNKEIKEGNAAISEAKTKVGLT